MSTYFEELTRILLKKDFCVTKEGDELVVTCYNNRPLCRVKEESILFKSEEADREALDFVLDASALVKEYTRIMDTAQPLTVVSGEKGFKILADFNGVVLAGRYGEYGANFVTWTWDYGRKGVSHGNYFMEDYEGAKKDFAVRSGLVKNEEPTNLLVTLQFETGDSSYPCDTMHFLINAEQYNEATLREAIRNADSEQDYEDIAREALQSTGWDWCWIKGRTPACVSIQIVTI